MNGFGPAGQISGSGLSVCRLPASCLTQPVGAVMLEYICLCQACQAGANGLSLPAARDCKERL
jgi:hypothetical protein